MHVLYFHQHFSTPQGSTGNRSYEMAQALIRAGHSVTMVCGRYAGGHTGLSGDFEKGARHGNVDGIDIVELDLPYSNNDGFLKRAQTFLSFAMRSINIALSTRYDLVFATTTPLTAGIPGIFARWLRRKPFVFEVRDLWPELPKAMGVITNPLILFAMSCLEWMSYRSAHHCIGLAPGIVDGIAERGVPRDRISLVPNGCDIEIFQSAAKDPNRPDMITQDQLVAIYGGTHGFANGLHNVLNAARVLKQRGRDNIRFLLVGRGVEKAQLMADAKADNLDNVIFLDPVPKPELARLIAGADIGLQMLANVPAFYFGTSPNKFFDYISAGKPVLINYPGWVANMVEEEACGYAVPPDDSERFADALEQAAKDKSNLPVMGQNSLSLARRNFDRLKLADEFVSALETTYARKTRR